MTPRIYSQEVHHCMFCPNVSHDKSMCMALGLNQRRAVPVHGTPDWCELPTPGQSFAASASVWATFAATVPEELRDSVPATTQDWADAVRECNAKLQQHIERKTREKGCPFDDTQGVKE